MKYYDQLKDDRWKKVALEVKKRDGFKCVVCDSKEKLNAHHKRYVTGEMAWETPLDQLVTLCRCCHRKFHEIDVKKKAKPKRKRKKERVKKKHIVEAKYTRKEGKKLFGKMKKEGDRCYHCGHNVVKVKRSNKPFKKSQKYYFSHLLKCGSCGASWNMDSARVDIK